METASNAKAIRNAKWWYRAYFVLGVLLVVALVKCFWAATSLTLDLETRIYWTLMSIFTLLVCRWVSSDLDKRKAKYDALKEGKNDPD